MRTARSLFLALTLLCATTRAGLLLPARNLLVLPQSETDTSLVLLWDNPDDLDRVAAYEVYQDGKLRATTPSNKTFYAASGLKPGQACSFFVVGVDRAANKSPATATVTATTKPAGRVLDVTAAPYYAQGDGKTKNTAAIQKAIDDCPSGGTVKIPSGTFLTGPLALKSQISLWVAAGGILKGSTDPDDYRPLIRTRYMGVECDCFQPLIRIGTMDHNAGYTTRNVSLYGEGEIRGGGETLGLQEPYDQRSRLILIQNAQNVALLGLHLTYPAGWTIHPVYSDNITVWKVWIESWDAKKGKSGDGFDPDSSSNCYLVNSIIHTWDNSFSPKSGRNLEGYQIGWPTKHIRVVGCTLKGGAPSLGSEVSGGIEDVVVRDSTIIGTYYYIKTNDGRGGYIRNFTLENVQFQGESERAIWVDTNYEVRNRPPKASPYTACSGFAFKHLRGCGSITMDGSFQRGPGPAREFYIHDVAFADVELREGSDISVKYCDGIKFDRVRCADGRQPTYTLNGMNYNVSADSAILAP